VLALEHHLLLDVALGRSRLGFVGHCRGSYWLAGQLCASSIKLTRRYARIVTPEELANLAHLRRARDLIDREYARPLEVAALARAALMSTAHFSRQFRATYGETPYAYLMTRRIERAKALLRRGDISVTEICMAVGCLSLGSFSARFTQLVGETPTAYRARDHSALGSVPGCVARDITRPSRKPSRIGETPVALAP
jgi:AraC-like DNA-binding protein